LDSIVKVLEDAATMAFPLTVTSYEDLRRQKLVAGPSSVLIQVRFGSWIAACASAGVECGSTRSSYKGQWSDGEVLAYVTEYLDETKDVLAVFGLEASGKGLSGKGWRTADDYDRWARDQGAPSAATVRNRFGSWTEAKRLASLRGAVPRTN
jgi:hypothetical protein